MVKDVDTCKYGSDKQLFKGDELSDVEVTGEETIAMGGTLSGYN